jgi:4-hydroxybenzoate polyprenyltransferase
MTQRGNLVTWGRSLRLSLLPTAMADGLAGFAIAGLTEFPTDERLLLFASSACVYHGAMALNDWADRDKDATERPDRPIPSGELKAGHVLLLASALISLGLGIAFSLNLQLFAWMAAIAGTAIAYDLWLRGPVLGPLCLGACRAMHMAAPIAWLAPERLQSFWYLPAGYGLYVFTLSRLARLEEKSPEELGTKPRALISFQALCFATPLLFAATASEGAYMESLPALAESDAVIPWHATFSLLWPISLLALGGAALLMKRAVGSPLWDPARVQASVGTALRLLLIYSAACAMTGGGTYRYTAAGLILLGYPLAHSLRKVFPPT